MNEIAVKDVINIENMIYEIDGKEVMLDSDLAKLYNVETKRINEAVKNNPEKFPNRYLLRITDKDYNFLKSKISTSKGGSRKGHTAFVEQGVYMLATILKSKTATEVSIRIMDTFVKMRHYINYNKNILPRRFLFKFNPKIITKNSIFFKGDIYDAYSVLIEIINLAKEEIIIIDNYLGKALLDILRNINRNIIIISSNVDETLKNKYLKQYNNIKFIKNSSYHDRFIIIDRNIVYHCGASFKDLGKKCFSIHEINDKEYVKTILKNINIT